MKEIDRIERTLKWKFVIPGGMRYGSDLLPKQHKPVRTDAYLAYMQQQERIADLIFGGLEKAIVKLKS